MNKNTEKKNKNTKGQKEFAKMFASSSTLVKELASHDKKNYKETN